MNKKYLTVFVRTKDNQEIKLTVPFKTIKGRTEPTADALYILKQLKSWIQSAEGIYPF